MKPYLDLLRRTLQGRPSDDRTQTGTIKIAGEMMKYDLMRNGVKIIPVATTKKVFFKGVKGELLWFLRGDTNVSALQSHGIGIWDEWADENGDLGPVYGAQWRGAPAGKYFEGMSTAELLAYVDLMAADQRRLIEGCRDIEGGWDEDDLRSKLTELGIDQVSQMLDQLKRYPNSRRIIIDGWVPQYVPLESTKKPQENIPRNRAALPACHTLYQFITEELTEAERLELVSARGYEGGLNATGIPLPPIVTLGHLYVKALSEGKIKDENIPRDHEGRVNSTVDTRAMLHALEIPRYKLNLVFYCRSQDLFLGTVFNVASAGLFAHMVAQVTNMVPGQLTWMGGDCHIYRNLIDQVNEQITREPFPAPELYLNPEVKNLFDFTMDDIKLVNYQSHAAIKGEVAV